MTKAKLLVIVLAVGACGKKSGDKAAAAASVTKADADAVNALVPADLKSKVTFEVQTIDDGMKHHPKKYTFVAPKGWKKGFMPGELEPEKQGWPSETEQLDNTLGRTHIEVGTNCDGSCEPKDWAKVSDKVNFSQFTSGQAHGKIIKNVKGTNDRLLVFQNEPDVNTNGGSASITVNGQTTTTTVTTTTGSSGVSIVHAWWNPGDSKYYECLVDLGQSAASLEPAFEKACAKFSVED